MLQTVLYSQNEIINSPHVISSGGDTWIINNYNLCFTVGELAIETFFQNQIIFTQGFHQEEEYSIIDITEHKYNHEINIFPNPTQDELHIIFNEKNEYVDLSIKDIRGNTISFLSDVSTNGTTSMQLSQFSQGVYFIEILLKTPQENIIYQIQKIN